MLVNTWREKRYLKWSMSSVPKHVGKSSFMNSMCANKSIAPSLTLHAMASSAVKDHPIASKGEESLSASLWSQSLTISICCCFVVSNPAPPKSLNTIDPHPFWPRSDCIVTTMRPQLSPFATGINIFASENTLTSWGTRARVSAWVSETEREKEREVSENENMSTSHRECAGRQPQYDSISHI